MALAIIAILIVSFLVFRMAGAYFNAHPPRSPDALAWAPPAMYNAATTAENIPYGYRYLTQGEFQCGLLNRCVGVEIISSQPCPSGFRIEAIELDESGANVGSMSNAIGLVNADQRAKIVLTMNNLAARSASLAQASCF